MGCQLLGRAVGFGRGIFLGRVHGVWPIRAQQSQLPNDDQFAIFISFDFFTDPKRVLQNLAGIVPGNKQRLAVCVYDRDHCRVCVTADLLLRVALHQSVGRDFVRTGFSLRGRDCQLDISGRDFVHHANRGRVNFIAGNHASDVV